jgi:urease accessory protein
MQLLPPEPVLQRARGRVELRLRLRDGASRLERLYQSGSAKAILPRVPGPVPEAVLVNTAGGLAGGDRFDIALEAGAGARLAATTQAAERVYRSAGAAARVALR